MSYKEIEGNLISLALQGEFDAIVHGVNCFGVQKSGIAKRMNEVFMTGLGEKSWFPNEHGMYAGRIEKLGNIQFENFFVIKDKDNVEVKNHRVSAFDQYDKPGKGFATETTVIVKEKLTVINAYTQYNFAGQEYFDNHKPVDYDAITLCTRKINFKFKGLHIGLPLIGCGLAGGDWNIVKPIIQKELKDMNVTVVHYKKD